MNTEKKEIKCPTCEAWRSYLPEQNICHACGSILDKNEILFEERKKKGLIKSFPEPKPFLEIKDSYPWYLKVILHIVRPIYFIVMIMIAFVTWFVTWVVA